MVLGWFADRTWKNNRVIPNRLNYCVIFITYIQLTNLAAGCIIRAGGPRVGTHAVGHIYDYISLVELTYWYKGFISIKIMQNNLSLSRIVFWCQISFCVYLQLSREACSIGQRTDICNLQPWRCSGRFSLLQRLEIIRFAFTLLRWSGVRNNPAGKGGFQSINWKKASVCFSFKFRSK
jgi:hypothetical protein